jgi:hypothetical protein
MMYTASQRIFFLFNSYYHLLHRCVNVSDHKTCALLMTKMKEASKAQQQPSSSSSLYQQQLMYVPFFKIFDFMYHSKYNIHKTCTVQIEIGQYENLVLYSLTDSKRFPYYNLSVLLYNDLKAIPHFGIFTFPFQTQMQLLTTISDVYLSTHFNGAIFRLIYNPQ